MIYYTNIAQFYFMITPKVTLNGRHFSQCLCSFCFPLMQRDPVTSLEGRVSPHQECSPGLWKAAALPCKPDMFSSTEHKSAADTA